MSTDKHWDSFYENVRLLREGVFAHNCVPIAIIVLRLEKHESGALAGQPLTMFMDSFPQDQRSRLLHDLGDDAENDRPILHIQPKE